ncbi:MAG TPA: hypothetical protein VFI09_11075 [Solirubrobacterales bacterium]|nr:hypothetical protein [Solirubrobacterales bacterium]
MGEEEVLEILFQQGRAMGADLVLDRLRIIAEVLVGDEAQPAVVHHAVGEEQGAAAGFDPQHRVLRADRVHLEGDHIGGDALAEGEAVDRRSVLELVQARLVAEDWAVEALGDLRGVAQVVAVGEDDPLDFAPVEPLDAPLRQQRVDRRARAGDEMTVDLGVDAGVHCLPVEDALEELVHGRHATRSQRRPTIVRRPWPSVVTCSSAKPPATPRTRRA